MSKVESIMQKYDCDYETAQYYLNLLEEGYSRHQALVMSGLADPTE